MFNPLVSWGAPLNVAVESAGPESVPDPVESELVLLAAGREFPFDTFVESVGAAELLPVAVTEPEPESVCVWVWPIPPSTFESASLWVAVCAFEAMLNIGVVTYVTQKNGENVKMIETWREF